MSDETPRIPRDKQARILDDLARLGVERVGSIALQHAVSIKTVDALYAAYGPGHGALRQAATQLRRGVTPAVVKPAPIEAAPEQTEPPEPAEVAPKRARGWNPYRDGLDVEGRARVRLWCYATPGAPDPGRGNFVKKDAVEAWRAAGCPVVEATRPAADVVDIASTTPIPPPAPKAAPEQQTTKAAPSEVAAFSEWAALYQRATAIPELHQVATAVADAVDALSEALDRGDADQAVVDELEQLLADMGLTGPLRDAARAIRERVAA